MIQLIASCRERKTDSRFSFLLGRFPFQSGSHAFGREKKFNFGVFYSRFELSTNESVGEGKKSFSIKGRKESEKQKKSLKLIEFSLPFFPFISIPIH